MRKSQILLFVALTAGCSKEPVAQIHEITAAPYATGQFVAFDTEGSIDDHKEPWPMTFHWRIVDAPVGSAAEVFGADMSTFSFKPDQYGEYTVGLIADNGKVASAEALATVTVDPCGNEAPVIASITGTPGSPGAGEEIGLVAATSDADSACAQDASLTYAWALTSVPAGSTAVLSDASAAEPWFLADASGDYGVSLVVTDITGRSSVLASTTITAADCGSAIPSIDTVVVAPSAPYTADLVTLDITASDADEAGTCARDEDLRVMSEFTSRPVGSAATLLPSDGTSVSFIADVPGAYEIRSVVSDAGGQWSSKETSVTVGTCGSASPVAALSVLAPYPVGPGASLNANALVGDTIEFDASASTDADLSAPCSLPGMLSYRWSILDRPPASVRTLNDTNIAAPSLTPDMPGMYRLGVEVRDGDGHASYGTVDVYVSPIPPVGTVSGFGLEFVAGGTSLWNRPRGIAIHGDSVYVVQSSGNSITRTQDGVTSLVAIGGYLTGLEDVVYEPVSGMLFATSSTWDQIVRVDPTTGAQFLWSRPGDLDNPRSISLYTSAAGTPTLIAMSEGQRRAMMWTASSSAGSSPSGSEDFGGNGNLDRPYGIEGAVISNTNTWFTTDTATNRAWRTDGNNDRSLTQNVRSPRDIVRGPSGNLYIADSGSGQLLQMADCGNSNCPLTTIAVGTWEPWGLWFESPTSLLVTDRTGNAMYRITGNF